jgi:hypothetical protein
MATFTPFSDLPTELQLLTWHFAAPACILKLGWDRNTPEPASQGTLRPVSRISHVCQVARQIISKGNGGGSFPFSSDLFTFCDTAMYRETDRLHFSTKLDTLWIPSGE